MCTIVLSNPHNAFLLLDSMIIYGAMLGNLGITMPFNPDTGSCNDSRTNQAFLMGGKMVRYRNRTPIEPQNTTISAVCVLTLFTEASRRFRIRLAKMRRETGQACTLENILNMTLDVPSARADTCLRMRVYENPYAIAPLMEGFCTGPYDERFGIHDGYLHRVYAGPALVALEVDELAAGIVRKSHLGE